jgi:WD40 repeat protein
MFAKIMNVTFGPAFLSKVIICLLLFCITKPASAIEAQKPEISLADQIVLENKIHREEFYGDVKLLHSPYLMDVQFSADGSVLFSQAETLRLWRSDTGVYLGSIVGPARFSRFAQLNNSRWIVTVDHIDADDHGAYYGVPQNLPNLRIWDVITGKCLAIRRLDIPVNAFKIWIPSLATVEQNQTAYLILDYDEKTENYEWPRTHYLLGFQGQYLIPYCKLEFEDPIEDLLWVPQFGQLYVSNEYNVSGFDPVSKKILWEKKLADLEKITTPVDELIVIDQPYDISASLRIDSARQRWHLDMEEDRLGNEKMIWSKAANRVCYIERESVEINLFNAKTKKRVAPPTGTVNALSSLSANNFSGSFDYNDVFVFQFEAPDHIRRTFKTNVPKNSCVAISKDATTLLVGEASGKAYAWNLSNHKKLFTLTGVSKKLLCIAADTSQNRIVAGDLNGIFWRWNYPSPSTATPEKIQQLIAERNGQQTKSRLPDRRLIEDLTNSLCTLSPDGLLSLCFQAYSIGLQLFPGKEEDLFPAPGSSLVINLEYERKFGEVIATQNAIKQKILTPAIGRDDVLIQIKSSPNGRFALLVFNTGQVTIVDLQTGTLESIIRTNDKEIVDVDYHSDQKTLLVASFRGGVTAWNTETFQKTGSLQLYDARLDSLRSRVTKKGFDIVLGTRDTGLIVKSSVFPESEQKPQQPTALNLPFGGPLPDE